MPDQFYDMSWKDYSRAAEGYWIRHSRYMHGIRRLSYFIVRMAVDPKEANKIKEHKLFPLVTDPPPVKAKPVKIPKQKFDALANYYKDLFNFK